MRCRKKPESSNGIRNQGPGQQLRLRKERISGRIFGNTIGLEIMKRTVWSPVRIRKMSVRTLWRGRPPLKRKKRLHAE
jgi:hypothetical protein